MFDKLKSLFGNNTSNNEEKNVDNNVEVNNNETNTEEINSDTSSSVNTTEVQSSEVSTEVNEVSTSEESLESAVSENVQNETSTALSESSSEKYFMVVDDNKINLKVASKMLQDFNFQIETADSGFECLDKVKDDNKYSIIFMDIMMPEMNGVETMKKLKEMVGFNAPVIALTADAMEGSREKYLGEGFDEYISKPINKQILQDTLSKFVTLDQ